MPRAGRVSAPLRRGYPILLLAGIGDILIAGAILAFSDALFGTPAPLVMGIELGQFIALLLLAASLFPLAMFFILRHRYGAQERNSDQTVQRR